MPATERLVTLRNVLRASLASPPWFAAPVDAHEDEHGLTLAFHAPLASHGDVQVTAEERSLTLHGRGGAMRLCALPCAVDTRRVEKSRDGDLLRLRLAKKRPATDTKPCPVEPEHAAADTA